MPPPCGWTSRPREISASGGWTFSPGPSTRRQPSASTISGAVRSPRSVWTVSPVRRLDLRDLEARVAALRPQLPAQLAVVERAPAPRQPVAGRAVRRVEGHARAAPGGSPADAHRVQPRRRRGAGRGGALADLVAVDHEHVGAGAGQLAGDGQPGEARAADQHVGARVARAACAPRPRSVARRVTAAAPRRRAAAAATGARPCGGRARRSRPPRRGRAPTRRPRRPAGCRGAPRRARRRRRAPAAANSRRARATSCSISARSSGVALGRREVRLGDAEALAVLARQVDAVQPRSPRRRRGRSWRAGTRARAARSRRGGARRRRAAAP